jgi:glycosyltransferase involved in cell wall biosynthesis
MPLLQPPMQLLSVGRLVEKKGFETLLDAVALLRHGGHEVHAGIIGDGPLRARLEAKIELMELQPEVTMAGACDQDGVRDAMQAANCFVLPCVVAPDGDRDGLPNVLLEAAAIGLPIVGTDVGGLGDFLDDSVGHVCPPNDAGAVAEAVLDIFANPEAAHARCEAARRRVEERYDAARNATALAQAFREVGNSSTNYRRICI